MEFDFQIFHNAHGHTFVQLQHIPSAIEEAKLEQDTIERCSLEVGRQNLSLSHERLELRRAFESWVFQPHNLRGRSLLAWQIRYIRQRGKVEDQEMYRAALIWARDAYKEVQENFYRYPQHFFLLPSNEWILTPWTRLRIPFEPYFSRGNGYQQNAIVFWVRYKYIPSEKEEWDPMVRMRVAQQLAVVELPEYFKEYRQGSFLQKDNGKHYSIKIPLLPEGFYYSAIRPTGKTTYIIRKGELYALDDKKEKIVSSFAVILLGAILRSEENYEIHTRGKEFISTCRQASIEYVGD